MGRGESGSAEGMGSEETRSALRRASKDGDVDALRRLLDAGAHVNMLLDSYDLTVDQLFSSARFPSVADVVYVA